MKNQDLQKEFVKRKMKKNIQIKRLSADKFLISGQ
jgi:hypothetical protein